MTTIPQINIDILEETIHHQESFFEEDVIERFLQNIESTPRSWIIGLLWPYWCGKSTFLEEVKRYDTSWNIWVQFDARQYPDRKELRDGFVIQFTQQVLEKKYEDVVADIDGKKNKKEQWISRALTILQGITWLATSVVKWLTANQVELDWVSSIPETLKDLYAVDKRKVSRIFEYEAILSDVLKSKNIDTQIGKFTDIKTIYVIAEDIDRSWEEWLLFLETLKSFIDRYYKQSTYSLYNLIIICPIAKESWQKDMSRYMKVLRWYENFLIYQSKDIESFVEKLKLTKEKDEFNAVLQMVKRIVKNCNYNFRYVKFILRQMIFTNFFAKRLETNYSLYEYLIFMLPRIEIDKDVHDKIINISCNNVLSWYDSKSWEITYIGQYLQKKLLFDDFTSVKLIQVEIGDVPEIIREFNTENMRAKVILPSSFHIAF